ncbi:peptidase [Streptomyces amakusaensis]
MRPMRRALLSSFVVTTLVLGPGRLAVAEPVGGIPPVGAGAGDASSGDGSSIVGATPELSNGEDVDSRAEALEAGKYWTAERMARAIPADNLLPAPPTGPATRAAGPTGRPGSTPAASPTATRPGGRAARIADTASVGKVFFKNPVNGKNYVCSAAALNSPSKQMVVTAGHCVNTGGSKGTAGRWMRNWTYVPRYRDGARPFGTFAAKHFRSFSGWTDHSDLARDVAMVTTWPLNNKKLVNVTGGHGLSWNFSQRQATTVFGYPGNHGKGKSQRVCRGKTRAAGASYSELRCDFGSGASGGPWLREYDEAKGLGRQNGVMSTRNRDGWNRTPYFDTAVKRLFDAQGSKT